MKTILIFMAPLYSHYFASFGFALMWQRRGFDVVYIGLPHMRGLVECQKFKFEDLIDRYKPDYDLHTANIVLALALNSLLKKSFTKNRYANWMRGVIAYQKIILDYNPVCIFLDSQIESRAIYFTKYSIPIISINTKLSPKRKSNIPPLTSNFSPDNSKISRAICCCLWILKSLNETKQNFIRRFAYMGMDEKYFEYRLCKKYNTLTNNNQDSSIFLHEFSNKTTVILAPFTLEYNWYAKSDKEFFVCPIEDRDEQVYFKDEYVFLKKRITSLNIVDKKVIYISFNTSTILNVEVINKFLTKVDGISCKRQNWIFVLSVGNLDPNLFRFNNIFCLNFLPQLDMLTWTNVMISNGSLNSIKECLNASVPMLLCPLDKSSDQNGNSIRVLSKKWGLISNIQEESTESLYNKLLFLLSCKLPKVELDENIPFELLQLVA